MYWVYCIAADRLVPSPPSGYVRASSLDEALALFEQRDLENVNLYPLPDDFEWPNDQKGSLVPATE